MRPCCRARLASRRTGALAAAMALVLVAACSGGPKGAAQPAQKGERRHSFSFAAADGLIVEVENLAGGVFVEGSPENTDILLEATVHAAADTSAEAQGLADLVEISHAEGADRLVVRAVYPVDRYSHYYYPDDEGSRGFARMFGGSRTKMSYGGERVTVVNRPQTGAVALYADLRLTLPHGVGATIDNGVGVVQASGARGSLSLSTHSGDVLTSSTAGKLEIDTLGGDVYVSDHEGPVSADTGSGDIEILGVRGDVWADTGSGDVVVTDMDGTTLSADTGSGDIVLERVRGSILADTGSGNVRGLELSTGSRLVCDTGSGDVRMSGDLSQAREIVLASGSGDIDLELVAGIPSLHLWITSSTGAIDVELPGLEIIERDRSFLEARLGQDGARTKIETTSGDISIRSR